MKQTVEINTPDNANNACLALGINLPTLVAVGLQVVCEAVRENRLTVATVDQSFFGPVIANQMNLGTIARALSQTPPPTPDGPPTV